MGALIVVTFKVSLFAYLHNQPAFPNVNYFQANVNCPQYQQSAFGQPQYPPQFGQNLQQPEVNTGTTPVPSGTAVQGQNSQQYQ